MKNWFWIGDGWYYAKTISRKRKIQQLKALKVMGVKYYYDV